MGTVGLVTESISALIGAAETETTSTLIVIGVLIPFGFLFIPLIERSVAIVGLINTLQITSCLGFLFNALQLWPDLAVQLLAAILFALYRAFLFSIISVFNMEVFGTKSMGRLMGICFVVAALTNLLQVPLVDWTLHTLNGDCRPMLQISLLASVPLPLLTVLLQARRAPTPASSREQPLLAEASTPRSMERRPSLPGYSSMAAPELIDLRLREHAAHAHTADA